jgi:hypothetical protein
MAGPSEHGACPVCFGASGLADRLDDSWKPAGGQERTPGRKLPTVGRAYFRDVSAFPFISLYLFTSSCCLTDDRRGVFTLRVLLNGRNQRHLAWISHPA